MVHINEEGELIDISGSMLELGSDASCLLGTLATALKQEGMTSGEIADYVATILKTAVDAVRDKEVSEGIREGCRLVVEYTGADSKFRIYKKNGSMTGYKS